MRDKNGEYVRCPAHGKVCYTRREASLVIVFARNKRGNAKRRCQNKKIPKRAYFCWDCGFWHTTSESFFAGRRKERVRRLRKERGERNG